MSAFTNGEKVKVGFIGAGNMGSAIMKGINLCLSDKVDVCAFDSFSDKEQAAIARNILSFGSAYDYVLLDLPPALTKVTERLIGACDVVFIPIELGIFSIQGVPTVTGIVKKCGAKFGGCIINKYDKKNSADAQLLELLNETLGNKTLKSKIPYSKVIKNSLSGGLTAGEYMGWTSAAKSYADLAAEIRERV